MLSTKKQGYRLVSGIRLGCSGYNLLCVKTKYVYGISHLNSKQDLTCHYADGNAQVQTPS